jgi:hypothetical protein
VEFGSYLYQAGSSGAYGQAQAPTGTNASNAYWTVVSYGTDSTLVDANGHVAGWEEISFTAGVTPGTNGVLVGIGVQNPTNSDDKAGNALWVRNTNSGGSVATMGVRSVGRLSGQSTMDPQQPVLFGVPVPYTWQAWDNNAEYLPGDMVIYHGRVYQALTASLNVTPPDTPTANAQWTPLGYDDRVQMCLSGYAQAYSGEQVNVYPTLGQWTSGGYSGGCAYPVGTTASIATIPGHADGTVSATFLTNPGNTLKQGAIFRLQDSSNYWRAGRTALYLVQSGAVTGTFTYSTSFSDGDRVTAAFSGSNITIYRNGTQVLTITNSALSTATKVGMAVT